MKIKPKQLILCALFAALTGVFSQIAIPMVPVPINLAMFSVFMAGSLLGPKLGAISQFIYVLLGIIGLPVFAGFSGGASIIIGPTGGYIIGYIIASWATGFILSKLNHSTIHSIISMSLALALCYAVGTIWFMFITKTGFIASLMSCVIPFLIGDAIKIVVATLLFPRLRRYCL